MLDERLRRLKKNEYFKTAIIIAIVALLVFGFWYGLKLVLNTEYPVLAVISGSMCVPYGSRCDGWSHPFESTLHIGDLIVVYGVDPTTLNGDYPNSDVIVFHKPTTPEELIVHRIYSKEWDGQEYIFKTKGDGNAHSDPWTIHEEDIEGKVIGRIPYVGHIALFMRNPIGIPVIIALIVLFFLIEFIIPSIRKQQTRTKYSSSSGYSLNGRSGICTPNQVEIPPDFHLFYISLPMRKYGNRLLITLNRIRFLGATIQ